MVTNIARIIFELYNKYASNFMKHGIYDLLYSVLMELLTIETFGSFGIN